MSELIRRDLLPGLYITFGQDGTWLHFETSVRSGAFNLEVLVEQGVIAGESVGAWIEAYRKTLEKSISEPRQGLALKPYIARLDELKLALFELLQSEVWMAHVPVTGTQHDPANGLLHGYCARCRTDWPCQYSPEAKLSEYMREIKEEGRAG